MSLRYVILAVIASFALGLGLSKVPPPAAAGDPGAAFNLGVITEMCSMLEDNASMELCLDRATATARQPNFKGVPLPKDPEPYRKAAQHLDELQKGENL